jgi:hypothetical protein
MSVNHFFSVSSGERCVLGMLGPRDFRLARKRYAAFSRFGDYRSFATERDAMFLGYGSAGVAAPFQYVPLDAFERWSRLTGARADIDCLDEFAKHWRWRALNAMAPVVAGVGAPGDPERNVATSFGAQIVPILSKVFLRWCEEFVRSGLLPAPSLDVYATHVVECCLTSDKRAPRAAVSSA